LVSTENAIIDFTYEGANEKQIKLKYIEQKRDLLIGLKFFFNDKDIFYRPYPTTRKYCYDENDYLPKFNQLKGSLHKEILRCKLLVLDHPGTTWNIAMAANTPTLLIFNLEQFDFSAKTLKYIKEFQRLKIFHKDVNSLIIHLNSFYNHGDLLKWWNSDQIQNTRKYWSNEFALTDKFWFWTWIRNLKKIN